MFQFGQYLHQIFKHNNKIVDFMAFDFLKYLQKRFQSTNKARKTMAILSFRLLLLSIDRLLLVFILSYKQLSNLTITG